MKISVNEEHSITLEELFVGVLCKHETVELGVCARDDGLELCFDEGLILTELAPGYYSLKPPKKE